MIKKKKNVHWYDVFRRSQMGDHIFSIQGAEIANVLEVLERWQLEVKRTGAASGFGHTEEEFCGFLDGGYASMNGNYFPGIRGYWIIGTKAMRFMIHQLGLTPPKRRLVMESHLPTTEELQEELQVQIAEKQGQLIAGRIELEQEFQSRLSTAMCY